VKKLRKLLKEEIGRSEILILYGLFMMGGGLWSLSPAAALWTVGTLVFLIGITGSK